ncbi:MAG: T9SS type A sorting domain-containing protein [Flavipsychrobacter sp.]|nr:T9SS type A sorting domain-containing protein [Flavipsychrobacter sp.]
MKTSYLFLLAFLTSLFTTEVSAQDISFTNYKLESGAAGQRGAMYRFSSVTMNAFGKAEADCIVKIENITPGVVLKQLHHNTNNNSSVFQPEVEYAGINGPSWIEFSFTFVNNNQPLDQPNGYTMPEITTSVSGLNNYGAAHEFAECYLGYGSKVVYDNEITSLMISAANSGYRAENKWGKQNTSSEKISIVNKNITTIRVKLGVNRNNNEWAGRAQYKIELKNSTPDLATVYMPHIVGFQARMQTDIIELAWSCPTQEKLQDISIEKSVDGEVFREVARFNRANMPKGGLYQFKDESKAATTMGAVFYRLRTRDMEGNFEYSSVKMVAMDKKDDFIPTELSIDPQTGSTVLLTPLAWQQKQISIEIFNEKGELIKKITDISNGVQMDLNTKSLAAGVYVVRFTCGKQYSTQYLIQSESL